MAGDPEGTAVSRREVLRKAGIGAGLAWSLPIISSVRTPAFAQASPPGGGCITLPYDITVSAGVIAKSALHSLEFGLLSPQHVVVCSDCSADQHGNVGTYPGGTELLFYLRDHGGGCDSGCDVTYLCTDSCHARVTQTDPANWIIEFQDSGCGCGGKPCGLYENLTAYVSIT